MTNKTFQIDIPDTQTGRLHVGLSWDDIFDETTAKNLTSSDLNKAMAKGFLSPKILSFYILFALLIVGAYYQLILFQDLLAGYFDWPKLQGFIPFSWTIAIALIVLTGVAFFTYLSRSVKKGSPLLVDNMQKAVDLEGRDKKYGQFDIDLHCFVFDQDKNFLFEIDPTDKKLVSPDEPVCVYHSGEETDGAGVYDDETIHIETKKLPNSYRYFVFSVANDCAHDFDKINNLKVRLANSLTDETLLENIINSNEADGYAFCCVYKGDDKWMCKKIEKYIPFNDEWQNKITHFLQQVG